ncbi:thioredoxin reductase (NADPH) [Methanocella conradii HZ254]|uniref:Thioredoxin reductase (NADPH) n=1 Tax=Methanocella conradii (strain DSM 24694 / JCM 17849 / CGMCC 1.5162 / HZ254) TaxID=1041930 RepID=H8IA12_METCZ|nr:FAD-dependent oxidoreductase [Methanocella conradii]AFD00972.1 thioredoxin reductase (NADPH) [Methanocella conradii HZ254]
MSLLDLIVIGAGPAGMTAAIYAKRKGLSLLVITDSVGGQVSSTGRVENYPGLGGVTGPQLVSAMKKQLEGLSVDIKLGRVSKLEKIGDNFRVTTAGGNAYDARAVIIASGSHWRELGVPGEKEYKNRGVSYCATCDGPLFAGMDVAVVGGGNSAAEAVLDIINMVSKVYLVVRSTLKADKVMVDRIMASDKVTVLTGYTVERIHGNDFVEHLDIISKDGERKTLNVGGVFVEIGLSPNVNFARGLVQLNDRGEIAVDGYCRTSVPGVFAAGDVTSVPQKQIVVAAGEGAKAAMSAYAYLSIQK